MTNSVRSGLLALIAVLSALFLGGCSSTQVVARQSKAADERVGTYDAFTARVSAKANEDLRMMMLKIAASPLIDGRDRQALLVESVLMGSGGSAFNAWHPDDKTTWVITNRHVVDQMEEITLSYGRNERRYPAEIVYYSDDVDVAVLEVKAYLPLADMGPAPAETGGVLALGYPGVGPKQLFQITSGTVANECFRFSDVQRGLDRHCLTQHTAVIDHGSSGGPLLDARSGRVIGINSYGVAGRFLAVPSKDVAKVLDKAKEVVQHKGDEAWMRHELELANARFFAEMSSQFGNEAALARTVSPLLVLRTGFVNYLMWDNRVKYLIAGYEGMTSAMRVATLVRVAEDLEAADGFVGTPAVNPSDDLTDPDTLVRISLRTRAKKHKARETRWRYEFGHWRIVDYASYDMQKADEAFIDEFIESKSIERVGAAKALREWQEKKHDAKCKQQCAKSDKDEADDDSADSRKDESCDCDKYKPSPNPKKDEPSCDDSADAKSEGGDKAAEAKPAAKEDAKPADGTKPGDKKADEPKGDQCGPSAAPACTEQCPDGPAAKPEDKKPEEPAEKSNDEKPAPKKGQKPQKKSRK